MSKEEKKAIKQLSETTFCIYCEMLDKTGGNYELSISLTEAALKAIMQPQQQTGGSTFFMGEWGNDDSD